MKFNWGTGIVLVIITFMTGMAGLVYITFQSSVDLVHEDYYPRELAHQSMIEKRDNALRLDPRLSIKNQNESIEISFPDLFNFDELKGEIQIFRPSGKDQDVFLLIKTDKKGRQIIPTGGLQHGKYIVKIDWEAGDVFYYVEQEIFVKHSTD